MADSDLEAFLSKVDAVVKEIEDIKSGHISAEELERKEKQEQEKKEKEEGKRRKRIQEERERDEKERREKEERRRLRREEKERLLKLSGKDATPTPLTDEKDSGKGINYKKWQDIEDSSSEDESRDKAGQPHRISGDAWMKEMEKDANERAKDRRDRRIRADVWKEKGNALFQEGKYDEALAKYDTGLEIAKDHPVLHANRAQVYLKLSRFDEAIKDCDVAIMVDASNPKPFVRRSRAHRALHKYDEAIADLKQAMVLAPENRQELQKEIDAALNDKKLHEREEEIRKQGEEGEVELRSVEQLGKELLKSTLDKRQANDISSKLSLLLYSDENRVFLRISGLLDGLCAQLASRPELVLNPISSSCSDNGINQIAVMENGALAAASGLLRDANTSLDVRISVLELLEICSQHDRVRASLSSNNDLLHYVVNTLSNLKNASELLAHTAGLLRNLALDDSTRKFLLRSNPEFIAGLLPLVEQPQQPALLRERIAAILGNLCTDASLRDHFATNGVVERLLALVITPTTPVSIVEHILGALLNASLHDTARASIVKKSPYVALTSLFSKPPIIAARAASLIARCCRSDGVLAELKTASLASSFVKLAKSPSPEVQEAAARVLAMYASQGAPYANDVLQAGVLDAIQNLLASTSAVVLGNACICLADCTSANESVARRVRKQGMIPALVDTMHKQTGAVQKNVAIALARLCKDKENLELVRDLHGIEMMFHYVK